MPTKTNKASEPTPVDSWNWLFKWLFILGGVAAGVMNVLAFDNMFTGASIFQKEPVSLITVLMLVAIVVGIFYFDSDNLVNTGIRYLVFSAVAPSISGFYKIGNDLAHFFVGFSYFLGPVMLTVCVVYFVKKYILGRS